MSEFVRNLRSSLEDVGTLRSLLQSCIELGRPYASEIQLDELVGEIALSISHAFAHIPSPEDFEEQERRIAEQEQIIERLKKEIIELSGIKPLTFEEIAAAKARASEKKEG